MEKILAVNAGSSSLKFQLFEMPKETVITSGIIERIGLKDSIFKIKVGSEKIQIVQDIVDHKEAVLILLDALKKYHVVTDLTEINGVGHRIVHGGEYYDHSVIADETVIKTIESLSHIAPLHIPANLLGVRVFQEYLPHALPVVIFDTAFHQSMTEDEFLYPIPYEYYTNNRIRRYGFHGTSHYYVSRKVAQLIGKPVQDLNLITLHLGNGASITAIEKGKSVNTSMGFTPLGGIMMGTRSGDLDPAILPFIMDEYQLNADEMLDVLNKKSGMLGISGLSSDARDILAGIEKKDPRAILTLEMYGNRVRDMVGSYYLQLGHVDALVFTGGIGENAYAFRKVILDKCQQAMGLDIDDAKNQSVIGSEAIISEETSKIAVWVVPTNEELVIARDTYHFLTENN